MKILKYITDFITSTCHASKITCQGSSKITCQGYRMVVIFVPCGTLTTYSMFFDEVWKFLQSQQ